MFHGNHVFEPKSYDRNETNFFFSNQLINVPSSLFRGHTSFFIVKKEISLCYGLGLALVHQDFPFQSIREKEFQKRIKGMANSCFAVSFFVIWRAR